MGRSPEKAASVVERITREVAGLVRVHSETKPTYSFAGPAKVATWSSSVVSALVEGCSGCYC